MRSAYAVQRPIVNAYLVRERDRRRLRELAVVLLLVLPLGLALGVDIWLHLGVVEAGYRIHQLERRLDRLSQTERRLRLEAAYLASPQRIERRAAEELGMTPPALEQLVFAEELAGKPAGSVPPVPHEAPPAEVPGAPARLAAVAPGGGAA